MEDGVPAPPRRRRLRVAVAATLFAVPLLLLDNLADDGDGDVAPPTGVSRSLAPMPVPLDRPETGPAKGISVVTTSTTASTVPITAATTTTRR